jgi:hypothetical protein
MLYFVGSKCRDPDLRRQTLDILRETLRREGAWDSMVSARIIETQIAIEEGQDYLDCDFFIRTMADVPLLSG